jgi:ATP-binding cassette, subfamily B, bacterial
MDDGKLDDLIGHDYGPGRELSGGQWQKVGLARALMRPDPLLFLLDEPASALDPAAEHALFERYTGSARLAAESSGAITLMVSHRFSAVRMADLIVVLAGGRVIETGTHAELIANGGLYEELYSLKAQAYR